MQSMYQSDGPSLSVDEQLRGSWELETFYFISVVHVVVFRVLASVAGVELLHVR